MHGDQTLGHVVVGERIKSELDEKIRLREPRVLTFRYLFPNRFLEKEAEHVDGFGNVIVVTHHRLTSDW
jgi:hypothetical protein